MKLHRLGGLIPKYYFLSLSLRFFHSRFFCVFARFHSHFRCLTLCCCYFPHLLRLDFRVIRNWCEDLDELILKNYPLDLDLFILKLPFWFVFCFVRRRTQFRRIVIHQNQTLGVPLFESQSQKKSIPESYKIGRFHLTSRELFVYFAFR